MLEVFLVAWKQSFWIWISNKFISASSFSTTTVSTNGIISVIWFLMRSCSPNSSWSISTTHIFSIFSINNFFLSVSWIENKRLSISNKINKLKFVYLLSVVCGIISAHLLIRFVTRFFMIIIRSWISRCNYFLWIWVIISYRLLLISFIRLSTKSLLVHASIRVYITILLTQCSVVTPSQTVSSLNRSHLYFLWHFYLINYK